MLYRATLLKASILPALSIALAACGGSGGSAPSITSPVVVKTPPVINVTVNATEIPEGTYVVFEIDVTDDTSEFYPSDLFTQVPDGFLGNGADPADSWTRAYFAEAVDEDTPAEFKFSVTDDDNNKTTESSNITVKNFIKSPSDDTVFLTQNGTVLGDGATARINFRGATDSYESILLHKFDFKYGVEAYLTRQALGGDSGEPPQNYVQDYVGSGTQHWGAAIEALRFGDREQDVIVMADFAPKERGYRLGLKTGIMENADDGFVELQSFRDLSPCEMKTGKISTSEAIYNDVIIGLETSGIRLFANEGNLGSATDAGRLQPEIASHIISDGSFCDISLFGSPVEFLSSVNLETGFLHIWENEFGRFDTFASIDLGLPLDEAILGYDAVETTQGDLVHAIISSTGEMEEDMQRLTIIVTDEGSGAETLRWDRRWAGDRPTSVFVGDLSAPMAQISDRIDILMAIPEGSHAGVLRDGRADKGDFSELTYGDLSFAPISINVHDLSPSLFPNNLDGGFIALSSANRGKFLGPITLYDVPE